MSKGLSSPGIGKDFFFAKPTSLAVLLLVLAGLVFASVSLVNHYHFRTYALDLGIYNNAAFDYAHFRFNDYPIVRQLFPNALADHFSLVPVFVSPLIYVFGTYTLLIVQVIAILFGGWGVYRFFNEKFPDSWLGHLAMLHFFSIWEIYSALSFDYHDNVIGTMFVPWFFYSFERKDRFRSSFFFALILITKENMALWAVFIALGLALVHRNDVLKRKQALLFSLIAALYFLLIVNVVMKSLGYPDRGYFHFKYAVLGATPGDAIRFVFMHPLKVLQLFFVNHSQEPFFDGIKQELYTMLFLSGGYALFFYPHLLFMIMPVLAQKVLSDDVSKWGINYQYSIEFAPILSFAAFGMLLYVRHRLGRHLLALFFISMSVYGLLNSFKERKSVWFKPADYVFLAPAHWHSDYNVRAINKALATIPPDAAVSASSPLVPHLAFRQKIYQYPDTADAECIVLLEQDEPYPLNKEEWLNAVADLTNSTSWALSFDQHRLKIFKKKGLRN